MSKKKDSKPKVSRSAHMIRLPADVFLAMQGLAQQNDRPVTREVRQALIAWLESKGKWPPAAST